MHRRRNRTFVALAFMLLCAAALGAFGAPPAAAYTVTGIVTNADTGHPLPGIDVTAESGVGYLVPIPVSATAVTDDDGRYSLVMPIYWVYLDDADFSILCIGVVDPAGQFEPASASLNMEGAGSADPNVLEPELVVTRDFVLDPVAGDSPPTTIAGGVDSAWHGQTVVATLVASDDTGIAYTEYRVDGGSWTAGTQVAVPAPADHSNDGAHTIEYRSVDIAGNVEETKSCEVRIDTTAPVASCSDDGSWHAAGPTLELSGTDALSGVSRVEYRLSPWGGWTSADSLTLPSFSHLWPLQMRAIDTAGNVSAVVRQIVRVDCVGPQTAAPWPVVVRRWARAQLDFQLTDDISPTCDVTIEIRNAAGRLVKTLVLGPRASNGWHMAGFKANLKRGRYRFAVLATDLAGNPATVVGSNRLTVR